MSFDWDKEISTCEVDYWQHEQRFFIDAWKRGFIEKKIGIVNWDPVDQTVMASNQVIDGKGWRSGAKIEKKEMVQNLKNQNR
jgi:leucyl-tRNA synthetase